MVPSSARETAPSRAYTPPAIHAARYHPVEGSCSATEPGVRRIPAPMVLPMVTASPNVTPSTRSSPRRGAAGAAAGTSDAGGAMEDIGGGVGSGCGRRGSRDRSSPKAAKADEAGCPPKVTAASPSAPALESAAGPSLRDGSPLPRRPFCSFLATAGDPSPNFGEGFPWRAQGARSARPELERAPWRTVRVGPCTPATRFFGRRLHVTGRIEPAPASE